MIPMMSTQELAAVRLRAGTEVILLPSKEIAEEYSMLWQVPVGYVRTATGTITYYAGLADESALRQQMREIYHTFPPNEQIPFRSGYGVRAPVVELP